MSFFYYVSIESIFFYGKHVSTRFLTRRTLKFNAPLVLISIYIFIFQGRILTRYTIYESLVKIQHFRHEWSLIMCENSKKRLNKIKDNFITCSHIRLVNITKCGHWLDTQSVEIWWIYVQPNVNVAHFCDIFFRHRAIFHPVAKTLLKIKNQLK